MHKQFIKAIYLLFFILVLSSCTDAQDEIGVWKIKDGKIIENDLTNNKLGKEYWQTLYNILPADLIDKYVVSLRLFTDGTNKDMGGLNQMDETVEYWQIDLDTADMNIYSKDSIKILDYTHTLIHEFGHLLTLNPTQIELSEDMYQDYSKGYLTSEGYALKNSYLGMFVNNFWKSDLLYEWDKIVKKRSESKKIKLLYEFYLSYSDDFVTDYAAESPEEDIAESWTFFVLSDKPKKSTILSEKILFFYQFPKLVKYREHIRLNIQFVPISYIENFKTNFE